MTRCGYCGTIYEGVCPKCNPVKRPAPKATIAPKGIEELKAVVDARQDPLRAGYNAYMREYMKAYRKKKAT